MEDRDDWLAQLAIYVKRAPRWGLEERRIEAAKLDGAWHRLRLRECVAVELAAANEQLRGTGLPPLAFDARRL